MNCPRCQTANGPEATFCGNCGTRLAPAQATAAPSGYGPPTGYDAPAAGTPLSYGTSAPAGQYPPPTGYPQGQFQPPTPGTYAPRPAGPAFNFNLNRLTRVDKIVAVATFVTFISLWLPWYSLSLGGVDGGGTYSFDATSWGHGWMWLELVVAIALVAYFVALAGWDSLPFTLPVAHAPLLIIGTGIQFLLVLLDFAIIPYGNLGMGWGWGAFIGLIAAATAAGPVIYPAVQSYRASRNSAGPRAY
jgi:hypothetical protein